MSYDIFSLKKKFLGEIQETLSKDSIEFGIVPWKS